jgi:hypothetical protein
VRKRAAKCTDLYMSRPMPRQMGCYWIVASFFNLLEYVMAIESGAAVSRQKINDLRGRMMALKEHL